MLIRSMVMLSVAGLLLVACGDKDTDTGADTAAAVEASNDENSSTE